MPFCPNRWTLITIAIVLIFYGLAIATVSGQTTTTSTAVFTTGSHTVYYTNTTSSSHTTSTTSTSSSNSNSTGKSSTIHVTPVEALIGLGLLFIFCVGAPFIWIYRKWQERNEPTVDW